MKPNRFRQCHLQRGSVHQIAWIPSKYARPGNSLRFREDETWSEDWCVIATYREVDERQLPDSHREIKGHRKQTGDAMPRLR